MREEGIIIAGRFEFLGAGEIVFGGMARTEKHKWGAWRSVSRLAVQSEPHLRWEDCLLGYHKPVLQDTD